MSLAYIQPVSVLFMTHRLHHTTNKKRREVLGDKSLALYNLTLIIIIVNIASHESLGTRLRQKWIKLRQWAELYKIWKDFSTMSDF